MYESFLSSVNGTPSPVANMSLVLIVATPHPSSLVPSSLIPRPEEEGLWAGNEAIYMYLGTHEQGCCVAIKIVT